MKKYEFTFKKLLLDLGVKSAGEAHAKYFDGVMTRQNVWALWTRQPKQISVETINIICNALDTDPSYLFRSTK